MDVPALQFAFWLNTFYQTCCVLSTSATLNFDFMISFRGYTLLYEGNNQGWERLCANDSFNTE